MSSSKIGFAQEGLERLARIVKAARGSRSFAEFQMATGLSHGTIWYLEQALNPNSERKIKEVKFSTLAAIAPHTPYTPDQLMAICQGEVGEIQEPEKVVMAEDALRVVGQLELKEKTRLLLILVDELSLSPQDVVQLMNAVNKKATHLIEDFSKVKRH